MNKENIEGGLRKTAGQIEETAGRVIKDKQTTGQGLYDQAAGAAQSAYGQAKDMVASGTSAASKVGDSLSQAAAGAQDQAASFEATLEERIKNNPLVAVGAAIGIGFLLGKMT